MKIIDDWGELYSLSERNYRRYLREGAAGLEPDPKNYGRYLGSVAWWSIDATAKDYQAQIDFEALPATKDKR